MPGSVLLAGLLAVAQCETCHGPGGNSTTRSIPSIAGQPVTFLENQLVFFREGYAWCRIAQAYFRDTDEIGAQRVAEHLAFVILKLGKENLYLGRDYEQFTLRTMQEVAGDATASH